MMNRLFTLLVAVAFSACAGAVTPEKAPDTSASSEPSEPAGSTEPSKPTEPSEPDPGLDIPQGLMVSIQEYGVLPTNSAAVNKANLQNAIDEASESGLALYVTPVENGYPMDGGLVLRRNVSLVGAHGPTGRGTANKDRSGPTGSVFVIRDRQNVFISVESATRIEGIQFYYPDQTWNDPSKIIPYPATIAASREKGPQGVTLQDLSFYGEYFAMDFKMPATGGCEQILFENCYGYPLSGQFIAINRCWDIPRILHCHVNPANQREFGRGFSATIVDKVVEQKNYTYWIDATDNAVLMDVFTFGAYGGIYLGPNTYGQLTNFNLDCVAIGIYRTDGGARNRTWQISQGSIIANLGTSVEDVHPIVIDGISGHTTLTAVECFSGFNGGTVCVGQSKDFLYLTGDGDITVSMIGCRMTNYAADDPVTCENPYATVRIVACIDKNGGLYEKTIDPSTSFPTGIRTMFLSGDSVQGIASDLSSITLDTADKQEGSASVRLEGKGVGLVLYHAGTPVDTRVTHRRGHLHLSLYLSDPGAFATGKEGCIEVTSSGTCDKNEYAWHFNPAGMQAGWNEIDLALSEASISGGNPVLSAMNFLRIYHLGMTREATIKIDNVYFYQ